MALFDDATLVVSGGNYYTAPSGTAAPASLATVPASPWVNFGHTDLEEVIAFATEGGEATSLGTLQKRTLRTSYSNRIDTLTLNLQQWDEDSLKRYFGSNMAELEVGSSWLTVPDAPEITTEAFLGIITDGTKRFGVYAPHAEFYRGDDIEMGVDDFAGLPIQIKPLNYLTNDYKLAIFPLAGA